MFDFAKQNAISGVRIDSHPVTLREASQLLCCSWSGLLVEHRCHAGVSYQKSWVFSKLQGIARSQSYQFN